jgi:hypothetical protein
LILSAGRFPEHLKKREIQDQIRTANVGHPAIIMDAHIIDVFDEIVFALFKPRCLISNSQPSSGALPFKGEINLL